MISVTDLLAELGTQSLTLQKTSKVCDLGAGVVVDQLKRDYMSLNQAKGAERAVLSILNSILTHRRIYFVLTKSWCEELLKNDPNFKKNKGKGFDSNDYPFLLMVLTSGYIEGVEIENQKSNCYVYRVKEPSLLDHLESMGANPAKQFEEISAFVRRESKQDRRAAAEPNKAITKKIEPVAQAIMAGGDKPATADQKTVHPQTHSDSSSPQPMAHAQLDRQPEHLAADTPCIKKSKATETKVIPMTTIPEIDASTVPWTQKLEFWKLLVYGLKMLASRNMGYSWVDDSFYADDLHRFTSYAEYQAEQFSIADLRPIFTRDESVTFFKNKCKFLADFLSSEFAKIEQEYLAQEESEEMLMIESEPVKLLSNPIPMIADFSDFNLAEPQTVVNESLIFVDFGLELLHG